MPDPFVYEFAEYRLDPGQRVLTRHGAPVELGSRAMDVLLALLRRHGEVATKAAIMADVWPGTIVEDNNLTTQIAGVRRALGEATGSAARFIVTIPGRGYRFVAELRRIPTADAAPPATAASGAAPDRPLDAERSNLPLQSSSFIGRERELAELRTRLRDRALVTLVGAGGVGKTRTALKLAESVLDEFPDGVFLLELAPLTEDSRIAEALCRLLGVPATGDRPAEQVAVAMLRRKTMLLVLDNCEHVLGGAAPLVAAILRQCPHMRILATSREALSVPGEAVFQMPTLAVPAASATLTAEAALRSDAVRLFAERAADALGAYTLSDEDAVAVATICRRLDGVPLATELAAARLRMLKPAEIAARLENVFRLLTGGSRTALPRQQTLRATIDWSFSLLSAPEQAVLRRLSVFADGCSAEGATIVAGGEGIDPEEVFDIIGALVAKSLMVADRSGRATRYRMLETTRQYAAEKLLEAGETNRFRLMAEYLRNVFRVAETAWPTQGTDEWLAAYGPETENFRAAIGWAFGTALGGGDPALGVSLVAQASAIADEMSLQPDLRRWTQAALAHVTADTPPLDAAIIVFLYNTSHQKRMGPSQAPPEQVSAIARFRELGDRVWLNRALRQTAVARAMPGAPDPEVMAMLEEAASLLRPMGPHKDLATTLAHIGVVHFLTGDHAQSRVTNEQALAMRQALGDRTGVLASTVNLAELLYLDGETSAALSFAMQAEVEARHLNSQSTLALVLCNVAGYRALGGESDAAHRAATEGLALSRAIGQTYFAILCLEHLALALAQRGDYPRAARLLGFINAHYAATGQLRERLEKSVNDRLVTTLENHLAASIRAVLHDEGARWTSEQADAMAQLPVVKPVVSAATGNTPSATSLVS
jgi:predicted ATPase/DNA-binding winged helix-turn-helix (wHTH) protein